ncbi:MAG: tetratricopeptide repeat protein [Methylococcales bacterium]|nr:tetratricopeptide repeat protein [Methylococcales bacterium]
MPTFTLEQALQQAIHFHQASKLTEAKELYQAILQKQPTHADANHNLGILNLSLNQTTKALFLFKQALETNPNQVQFWLSYIETLIKTQQFALASKILTQGKEKGLSGNKIDELTELLASHSETTTTSLMNSYHSAINFREQGRYLEAIEALQSLLINHPNDATAYAHLAHCYHSEKKPTDAWTALNKALTIAPDLPVVQRNQVRLLLRQQHIQQASDIATQLYNKDSESAENTLLFATVLLAMNKIKPAKQLCQKALEQQPNYAEASAILGQIYLKEGNKKEALSFFETALIVKPHLTPLYPVVSGLHKENKNFPTAIKTLQKALSYDVDNVNFMVNLGELLRLNEETQTAIVILEKAIQLAPENIAGKVNLATAYQQNSELEKAKIIYQSVLNHHPEQVETLNNLGGMVIDDENWKDALSYFEKATSLEPNRIDFIVNKGVALNHLKRYPEAEDMATKALKIDDSHQNSHALLIAIFIKQGFSNKVETYCHTVLKNHLHFEKIHAILGSIFQEKNRLTDANDCYLRAFTLNPTDESYAFALSINHYLRGDHSLSTNYLQKSSSIFSKPAVKKFKSTKVYVTYLDNLLRWWKNGRMEEWKNQQFPPLAIMGESHCLAIHRTRLNVNQQDYHCQAYWIPGVKMWHLAQTSSHPMKNKIVQYLTIIPIPTPLLFTIGEIDCRFDEGIWVAAKKQGCCYTVLIEKTVTGYLDWLETNLKESGHNTRLVLLNKIY